MKDPARDSEQLATLLEALRQAGGNVSQAATAVGISRQRAYRLMDAAKEIDLSALREDPAHSRGRGGP